MRCMAHSFCAASQAAIALVSSSVKPLAMRSMMVVGRLPVRNSVMAATMSLALRPLRRGTGVATDWVAGWQPLQDAAPAGGSADHALAVIAASVAAPNAKTRTVCILVPPYLPDRNLPDAAILNQCPASRYGHP